MKYGDSGRSVSPVFREEPSEFRIGWLLTLYGYNVQFYILYIDTQNTIVKCVFRCAKKAYLLNIYTYTYTVHTLNCQSQALIIDHWSDTVIWHCMYTVLTNTRVYALFAILTNLKCLCLRAIEFIARNSNIICWYMYTLIVIWMMLRSYLLIGVRRLLWLC